MPVQQYTPYRSHQEAQTRPGYDLEWGSTAGRLFARVDDRTLDKYLYDLYGPLTANAVRWGSLAPPTPGSTFPSQILYDARVPTRKLLWHKNKSMIWEVFPSLNEPTPLFYLRTPAGTARGELTNDIGVWSPDFSEPHGYWFQGQESDITIPSEAGRFFIPPNKDTEIGLVNVENYEIRPQSLFIINQLQLIPYNPLTEFGARNIRRILSGSGRVTKGTPGREPYKYEEQDFIENFGVKPVQFDGGRIWVKKAGEKGADLELGEVS